VLLVCDMNNTVSDSLIKDRKLEVEIESLQSEMLVLSPLEMLRKVEIKSRIEAIGKERLLLFVERRKIYNGGFI
jgi:hypothetical protein